MDTEFDVIIAGAGITGVTIACLLAKQGLKLALIESQSLARWSPEKDNARVSAMNLGTIKIFKHIDIWDSIKVKRSMPYTKMSVWDEQTKAKIEFDSLKLGEPMLGYIVEHDAIIDSAIECLKRNYLVSIFENSNIVELRNNFDQVLINCQGHDQEFTSKLVIGADGTSSTVRDLASIKTKFYRYDQHAIITIVTLEIDHKRTAYQCFTKTGSIALLPLKDGRCSVVWSCHTSVLDHFIRLSDEEFCNTLSNLFERKIGKISKCEKRVSFPLKKHHVINYFKEKCVLIGDAAHVIHPVAGQGANMGCMDSAALAEVIGNAKANGKFFHHYAVLKRYERWRYGENQIFMNMINGLQTLFSRSDTTTKIVRQAGVNLIDTIFPIKYQLARYAMGIVGDLPKICRHPIENR